MTLTAGTKLGPYEILSPAAPSWQRLEWSRLYPLRTAQIRNATS